MKRVLKKKLKSCSKAIIYFSDELLIYWKPMTFPDGTTGRCKYSCS